MKKDTLAKWLLAGAAMAFAYACQQKPYSEESSNNSSCGCPSESNSCEDKKDCEPCKKECKTRSECSSCEKECNTCENDLDEELPLQIIEIAQSELEIIPILEVAKTTPAPEKVEPTESPVQSASTIEPSATEVLADKSAAMPKSE